MINNLNWKKILIFFIVIIILNELIYYSITDKNYFIKENEYRIEIINNGITNINKIKNINWNYPNIISNELLLNSLTSKNIYNIKIKNNLDYLNKDLIYKISDDYNYYILWIKIYKRYLTSNLNSWIVVNWYYYKSNSDTYLKNYFNLK